MCKLLVDTRVMVRSLTKEARPLQTNPDTIVKVTIPISVLEKATGLSGRMAIQSPLTCYGPNMNFGLPTVRHTPPNTTPKTTSICSHATSVDNAPTVCDPRLPAFLGATSCSNNTAELSGFAEAMRWAHSCIPAVLAYAFFSTPNTRPVSLLAFPTRKGT